ncbi:MAG: ATP-binding cassette domain-containing protein [Synechococcaceae cyanobacterium]|nr:ATP-binding cassette domain-containing protein [Synechococcaceae cyanobacterium]
MSPDQLQPHQEQPWPDTPQQLDQGEVLLVVEALRPDGLVRWRQAVSSHEAPCLLHPLRSDARLRFRLRAIGPATLSPRQPTTEEWSRSRQQLEGLLVGEPAGANDLELRLEQHVEALEQSRLQAFRRFEPFGRSTSLQLSAAVDAEAAGGRRPDRIATDSGDALLSGVNWLLEGLQRPPLERSAGTGSIRQRLQQLLDSSPVRCREVVIHPRDLDSDLGPVLAQHSEDPERIAFLRPSPSGYWIWEPTLQALPRPLKRHDDVLDAFSSRMTALLPRLQPRDLSLRGLLNFAYGQPGNAAALVAPGLILGGAIGFVLAIGREVGASQWIFGLGGLGGLLGLGLSVVSPAFRLPILATVFSTGLGLLIPTFNTIFTNQALPDRDLGLMLQLATILLAGSLAGIGLNWTRSSSLLRTQIAGTARLEFGSLDQLLQLPVSFFGREPVGALILRFHAIRSLADAIRTLLADGLLQALLSVIYLLFMLRISVELTLLAGVLALMLLVPTTLLALDSRRLERKAEEVGSLATGHSLELISAVSKLRLAGAEAAALRWWSKDFRRSILYQQAQEAREATSALLQRITPHLGTLLLFITITRLGAEAAAAPAGAQAAPDIGELLGFLAAFATFIGSMAAVAGLVRQAVDLPVDWERARPILLTAPEVFPQARDPGELSGRLEVDRVSFRYGPERPLALDRVSLRMDPGEFVALVGPSGSGKSSLIRLLLGFASPEEGVIRYDDQNLAGLRITAVRRQIGTVMQNAGIFCGTIFDTIAGSAIVTLEQAWEAAELVGLADDIRAMPMGMQTMVPEGGGTFSGGQRQRLAIARALVRRPKILIFDEATSALDNRTQAIVTRSLEQLAVSRLVVAHRLSTIVHAHRIVTIDRGRVVQCGRYEALMRETDGVFAGLMRRQIA